jgi:ATP-dependent RNA helicase DeaD
LGAMRPDFGFIAGAADLVARAPDRKNMNDLALAGPLQAALADKGYATLTPVQEAVIKEDTAGRDLLVSAQTGSGKTVAFGLAIAPEVLGGVDRLMPAEKPLALVVAPTRELALQVKAEFEWLYGPAGVQLASCVGGMDYRTERRALDRGAHVVVGTPGRLRDHIERGSLDLSEARAVVLDEADEMLDLGFAEDLEFILGSAPEERRTLMFSATVPKEIEKLARTFQRDALRVVVQGEARQHADIAYQALSVQARDKEHAIFNVLRFHEAQTAIVFAKTRANVNHLFARMINRGFQAVALSGELTQSERMHALQALRDGRARVCIATDVAARGIDLPGLELVIHADLPTNSETLLHRSGRTGRAGRKGTSVLIVPPAEYRKAQRILQGAKVEAAWGSPPGADDVQAREDLRLMEHPMLAEGAGEEAAMAGALLERWGPEAVSAAFVRLWRSGRSAPEVLSDALPPAAPQPPRERGAFGPAVWFRLTVGHTGRAEARWLLPKICDAGGITKDAIGAIRVQQDETFVQIAENQAGRFGAGLEIEPGLSMEKLDGEPDMSRPQRSFEPRAPRVGAASEGRAPERREKAPYKPKPARIVEEDGGETEETPARKTWPRASEREARKPYAARDEAPHRPAAREDAPRKPWAERSAAEAPKKPWRKAEDAAPAYARAPRGEGETRPRAPREEGDRKPWAPRAPRAEGAGDSGSGKPAYRSAGFKSHGGKDGQGRATGYKSHASDGTGAPRKPREYGARDEAPRGGEGRPYTPREGKPAGERSYGKPAGAKPAGAKSWGSKSQGDKPYGAKPYAAKPAGRPARPAADAKDTSKRFTPPKKPRG